MRTIKCLSITLVFCIMTLFVAVCSSSASSPVATTDPKETVIKAYQKFQRLKSYHMTIDFVSSVNYQGKNLNILVAKGDCDVQVKPMLMKNTMTITMDIASPKIEQQFVQYIEESKDQITVYLNADNQWIKQSVPYNHQLNEYNYKQAITSVTIKSEDANSIVFEVIVSGSYLKENFERNLAAGLTGMQNMQAAADLFKDAGDFKYTITVDKKTATISKTEMDLSDFIAKLGNKLIESQGIPDEQKKTIKEMFDNMKIIINITFSKMNSGEKITIPKEAKNALPNTLIPTKKIDTHPSEARLPKISEGPIMYPNTSEAPVVYPAEARLKGWEGKVLLRVTISDQGTVTDTKIIESSGYDILDNAAVDSVTRWRYSPKQIDGKAVTYNAIVPIRFQLENNIFPSLYSAEVNKIQQKLNKLGFACGEPDGIMDNETEQAIKDFQRSKGLEPDGIVGPETKEALGIE